MRALPLFALALAACTTQRGDGVQANELRALDSFTAVSNASSVPMYVDVGPEFTVDVICDENLLEFIQTEIHNGSLHVTIPDDIVLVPGATCEIAVSLPMLERVQASGLGEVVVLGDVRDLYYLRSTGLGAIEIADIDTEHLRVITEGGGRTVLAGAVDVTTMSNWGAAGIEAVDLVAGSAFLTNKGSGDITVTVTDYAQVTIQGDGDVDVEGDTADVEVIDDGCGDAY